MDVLAGFPGGQEHGHMPVVGRGIKGGAIIDHETPRERRIVSVEK
jgi:hypothetical protein